jgi:hypothetical protein
MAEQWTGWKRSPTNSIGLRSEIATSAEMQWKEQDNAARHREAVAR